MQLEREREKVTDKVRLRERGIEWGGVEWKGVEKWTATSGNDLKYRNNNDDSDNNGK